MRCLTTEECEQWLSQRQRQLPQANTGLACHTEKTEDTRAYALSQFIASMLTYREPVLLWITEWGIWTSSENWHLYYKLRQSHGDHHFLDERPGHLFLNYEMEELASFFQIALMNGWGGYILTAADYVNAFFSHDEYIDFYAADEANLAPVLQRFKSR